MTEIMTREDRLDPCLTGKLGDYHESKLINTRIIIKPAVDGSDQIWWEEGGGRGGGG